MRRILTALVAVSVVLSAAPAMAEDKPAAASQPQLIYTSYYVLDQKRALDFYVGLLGMQERTRITPSPGVTEILLGFDDQPASPGILLMHRADRTTPYTVGDGFSRTLLRVDDIKSVMKRLSAAGVTVVKDATEVKNLRLSYSLVRDPDGYMIEFIQNH